MEQFELQDGDNTRRQEEQQQEEEEETEFGGGSDENDLIDNMQGVSKKKWPY